MLLNPIVLVEIWFVVLSGVLILTLLCLYFCRMYFRSSLRINPATKQSECYWRLVESYSNEFDKVCHKTLYTVGLYSTCFR